VGTVVKFKKTFTQSFESAYRERPIPLDLPSDQKAIYDDLKERSDMLRPRIQSFSDSLVIYVPLIDLDKVIQLDGIYATLLAIAYSFIYFMADENVFRGGIDIGYGVEIDDNEIYGPAIVKAYDLESKVAKYPRIVISDTLERYLFEILNKPQADPVSQNNRGLAKICREMLMVDGDGRYAIDYLGYHIYSNKAKKFIASNLIPKALSFLQKQLNVIKEKKDIDQYLYYNCLVPYFEDRLPLWGVKANLTT
jgi:hypothetical protein